MVFGYVGGEIAIAEIVKRTSHGSAWDSDKLECWQSQQETQ